MARDFVAVTQDDINLMLANGIKSREVELAAYDHEIENYNSAIAALGDITWDATALKYRGMTRDVMITRAMSDGLTSDQIQVIGDLLTLDTYKLNLHGVQIELAKSEAAYNTLLQALPAGKERDAAFAAAAAKANA